ncbi:hypothetical protein [Streptomyces sp. NPDC051162]|uniref:hypothetical protein n=1 Tax=Streptomyces sp. NPDC051162 TaxID=3154747 RepID=UPI00344270E7
MARKFSKMQTPEEQYFASAGYRQGFKDAEARRVRDRERADAQRAEEASRRFRRGRK